MKKIYCFDLDGTLCTLTRGNDGAPSQDPGEVYAQAKPLKDRIAVVNKLYDEGHKIYIDTARGTQNPDKRAEWLNLTSKQLIEWGVQYHGLRLGVKIAANFYIDDMAQSDISFFGHVEDSNTDSG